MTKSQKSSAALQEGSARLSKLGDFFREQRLAAGVSEDAVMRALELESLDVLRGYESGEISIPLEDVFALTNLLNVSPEEVMDLVHALLMHGNL